MINRFLQSLKMIRPALILSRAGLSRLLPVPPFGIYLKATVCFKPEQRQPVSESLKNFIQSEQSPILKIFAAELAWKEASPLVDLTAADGFSYKEREKLRLIFQTIVKFAPEYQPAYRAFVYKTDLLLDKRLYAAELENLNEAAGNFPNLLPLEIDWKACHKKHLALSYPRETTFVAIPKKALQKNLAELWAYLFFQKSILIENWQDIAVCKDKITFRSPILGAPVSAALKNKTASYLRQTEKPKTYEQYRLFQALQHVQQTCPEISLSTLWKNELAFRYEENSNTRPDKEYLNALQQTDYGTILEPPLRLSNPRQLEHLLRPENLSRDKRFANSSLVVVWTLALLIFLLLTYF